MIDMKGGKVKVEKTENHEFLEKFPLNLANFDKTLFYTSLKPNWSCQKSWKILLDCHELVERCVDKLIGFFEIFEA